MFLLKLTIISFRNEGERNIVRPSSLSDLPTSTPDTHEISEDWPVPTAELGT